ncbi:hypothetical protein LIER_22933 [Lithospermum erythrorhizon]|uniref:Uncharacterized protein n=1 Tax=Lithospermum erythrorhizon TaxID=34254 RepID=A0AAV3QY61_LITER
MENSYEDSSSSNSQSSFDFGMEILENELMNDSYKPSQNLDTSHNIQQPLNLPPQNQQENSDFNFLTYKTTMGSSFHVNFSQKDDYTLNSILEPWRKNNVGGNDVNNTGYFYITSEKPMTNPPINPTLDDGHQGLLANNNSYPFFDYQSSLNKTIVGPSNPQEQNELFPTNFSALMQPTNQGAPTNSRRILQIANPVESSGISLSEYMKCFFGEPTITSAKDSLKDVPSKITNESNVKGSNPPPIAPNVVSQVRKDLNWWRKKEPINKLILTQLFAKKTRAERAENAEKEKNNDDQTTKIPSKEISVGNVKKLSSEPVLKGVVIGEGQGGQNIGTQEATPSSVDMKGKGLVMEHPMAESSSDDDMWLL